MARTVGIGIQEFNQIIENNCFYIDKTYFIKEWWESMDSVTLITRPRRFGKTLTMSMVEQFFSINYAGRSDLFEGLSIWKEEKYQKLQGTYPVISLSFANMKEKDYQSTRYKICQLLVNLYNKYSFIRDSGVLTTKDIEFFDRIDVDMNDVDATLALYQLSDYLYRYYGKKVIILLDEYDTPMQEAYVRGYWEDLVTFARSLFNATFKTNVHMECAIMTGITRVSKESIFSDLNNLKVITTTSNEYATTFGFTEAEVFAAMDEFGMKNKEEVKMWYDGFIFGEISDIYNPWSVINLLDTGKIATYWANTSSNSLVSKLIREGSSGIKEKLETLLMGGRIQSRLDEQILYNQLDDSEDAIWSLLLASGYLKVINVENYSARKAWFGKTAEYELELTNLEVCMMFGNMISGWFGKAGTNYNNFVKALLLGDVDAMNEYMNRVSGSIFSYFDTGKEASTSEPERFYHGFVLGLIVELEGQYIIQSNRESGFGRYDVILESLKKEKGIIIEFKVYNPRKEKNLEETAQNALQQVEEKKYAQVLLDHGVKKENICKYAFAFQGKTVLIESSEKEE